MTTTPKVGKKLSDRDRAAKIAELRAEREKVSARINAEMEKKRELSAQIRELEGPLPDRSNKTGTGYKIRKNPATEQ